MSKYIELKKEIKRKLKDIDCAIELERGGQMINMMMFDTGQMAAYRDVMNLIERLEKEEKGA